MIMMKRGFCFVLAFIILAFSFIYSSADTDESSMDASDGDASGMIIDADAQPQLELSCEAAVLMEATSGTVLFEINKDTELPPASVTKIMTLLLVAEAIDAGQIRLSDSVTISTYAASMGGSQVFLEEGEQMTVEDLIKCTVIASANDAAVALAEHLLGSESAFVDRMNQRASELGLNACHFENATGLDDDTQNHVLSANDIAVISRELIRHPIILKYSGIWMDTIRGGEFTLTNTNRLIRFYQGATGLKTGSTDKAKFCISATATRDNMTLIAVIMAAPSRDARNTDAKKLFDWGFASYGVFRDPAESCTPIKVCGGTEDTASGGHTDFTLVLPKADLKSVEKQISLQPQLCAPVEKGTQIGTVTYRLNGEIIGTSPITAEETIPKIDFLQYVGRVLKIFFLS